MIWILKIYLNLTRNFIIVLILLLKSVENEVIELRLRTRIFGKYEEIYFERYFDRFSEQLSHY